MESLEFYLESRRNNSTFVVFLMLSCVDRVRVVRLKNSTLINPMYLKHLDGGFTVFIHASFLTFLQSACPALIPMRFIDNACAFIFCFANITTVATY